MHFVKPKQIKFKNNKPKKVKLTADTYSILDRLATSNSDVALLVASLVNDISGTATVENLSSSTSAIYRDRKKNRSDGARKIRKNYNVSSPPTLH